MKVILLQDIEKLGKKYDVKEVSDGYARNFLLPKGLARLANKENLKWLDEQKNKIETEAEKELKEAQAMAGKLEGMEVIITVKVGEEQQLFESITAQKISDKLKEMGFSIKKEQIQLEEPIKDIGEFPLKVSFSHNLEAEIIVIITEEK